MKKREVILITILTLINLTIFFGIRWINKNVGLVSIDEIIFHLRVPLSGTSKSMIGDIIITCVIPILVIVLSLTIILIIIRKYNKELNIKILKKEFKINLIKLIKIILIFINIVLLIIQLINVNNKFKIIEYIKLQTQNSNFIKENYVDPRNVNITFPDKKRNLIYIYLESMETTYMDNINGGIQNKNIIPELTNLSLNNANFSNTNKIGGALQVFGTTWTIGAMVSHTSGLPLKVPFDGNTYSGYDTFLPGVYNLGDILYTNGYKNMLMVGSDARFAGRSTYFKTHGNYEIKDYYTAISDGIIDKEHYVFWGMEDSYLFEYAKKELTNLSKNDEPFNFTLLTVNTHFPKGYLESSCENKYEDNMYASVISCSSKQVNDFVNWIKKQDFYDNTTIIIVGDHLTMADNDILNQDNYDRTIYNTIINPGVNTKNNLNRKFTTFDLFPTTLASMGVEIENNKLGLGVNLYSGDETLVEKYGLEYINNELTKKSSFYNSKFLYNK